MCNGRCYYQVPSKWPLSRPSLQYFADICLNLFERSSKGLVFWIQCSSPFQTRQLGHDVTKSVRSKTQGIDNKISERGVLPYPVTGNGGAQTSFFGVHGTLSIDVVYW